MRGDNELEHVIAFEEKDYGVLMADLNKLRGAHDGDEISKLNKQTKLMRECFTPPGWKVCPM